MTGFKSALKIITIAAAFVFFILLVFWGISASANTETELLVLGASGLESTVSDNNIGAPSDVVTSETTAEITSDTSDTSETSAPVDTSSSQTSASITSQPISPGVGDETVISADINDYENNTTLTNFIITNAAGMNKLSALVAAGTAFEGKTVSLANNIALGGAFAPIGNTISYFRGTFDGAGYIISGLRVMQTTEYAGLFAYIDGATIKNVVIAAGSSVTGSSYVGSVVGYFASGMINGCTSGATVSASQTVTSSNVGGIAGYVGSSAVIINSANTGSVSAQNAGAGGIAGQMNGGTIMNSYNMGTVTNSSRDVSISYMTGGIFGYDAYSQFGSSSVINCYNAGNVLCPSSSEKGGAIHGATTSSTYVNNCYYDKQYTTNGGTSSYQYKLFTSFYPTYTNINYLQGITGMTAAQMKSADLIEKLNNGVSGNPDLKAWTNSDSANSGYPYFGENTRTAYTVSLGYSPTGTVVSDKSVAYPGEVVTISVSTTTNVSDYDLSSISVTRASDGGQVATTAAFTFIMPESDVIVTPVFAPKEYNIATTVNNLANGTITLSKIKASQGTSVLISATPSNGNEIQEIKAYLTSDTSKVITVMKLSTSVASTTYTFTMPAGDVTVLGSFVPKGTATTTTTTITTVTTTTAATTTTIPEETIPDDTEETEDTEEDSDDSDDTDDTDDTDDEYDDSDDEYDDSDDEYDDSDDYDDTDDVWDDADDSDDDTVDDVDDTFDDTTDDTATDDSDSDAYIDDGSDDTNPVTNVPLNLAGIMAAICSALLITGVKGRKK